MDELKRDVQKKSDITYYCFGCHARHTGTPVMRAGRPYCKSHFEAREKAMLARKKASKKR